MNDPKLEERKYRAQKSKFIKLIFIEYYDDIVNCREENKILLRKTKLEDKINSKRFKYLTDKENELEIVQEKLELRPEILNKKWNNFKEKFMFIKELNQSNDINELKYGILQSRQFLCGNQPPFKELLNIDLLKTCYNIIQKHKSDIQLLVIYKLIN
jgi:hypothetical protein